MRILIIGANGMLGSMLLRTYAERKNWVVLATIRASVLPMDLAHLNGMIIPNIDITDLEILEPLLDQCQPDIVINAAALRSKPCNADEVAEMISVNAVWPQRLAAATMRRSIRLIHISTDGVFSGRRGQYTENDTPDPECAYSLSKLLGEPTEPNCVVLRMSLIGPSPRASDGLFDWFMEQKGAIRGHRRSIFSGFTTKEMAYIIKDHVIPNAALSGLFHLSSSPISKFEVLKLLTKSYKPEITVIPDDTLEINRSLVGQKFKDQTGYFSKSWEMMIDDIQHLGNI
jgi:dTDP-4-dehydrorhamnose reductase